jgi:hypothetical protein
MSSDSDADSIADTDSMAMAMAVAIAEAMHNPAPLPKAVANQHTALKAAMAYDTDSSSAHMGAPTSVDATNLYLTDSPPPENPLPMAFAIASDAADLFLLSSGSLLGTDSEGESDPIPTACATAADVVDLFLLSLGSLSGTDSDGESDHIATAFPTASEAAEVFLSSSETDFATGYGDFKAESAESPTTSQIENPTPSCITLPYSHVNFSYVDLSWLPGSNDMDTSEDE